MQTLIFVVYIGLFLMGYVLGSIPFGLVVARAFGLGDLRQIGSGNIGATNVLRTGNKLAALLTLIGDSGKGAFAVLIAYLIAPDGAAIFAAFGAILGHCFPITLGFKGGKGVATFLGTMLALSFPAGLAACATWLVMAAIFRFSSLAALMATATSPIWMAWFGPENNGVWAFLTALMALLVWVRHADNIKRLRNGTETKIGQKKS
ncbi:glycerol-3-phosphate 1-O-acyltransferase PlsY [Paracoccaceae bacterium GXU_MW_L88]